MHILAWYNKGGDIMTIQNKNRIRRFNKNNSTETFVYTDKKFKDAMMNIVSEFECLESYGECKAKEILGFDCDDNDNHCVLKQLLFDRVVLNDDE